MGTSLASALTLGNYRLLGTLGEGGMGAVYLGEHTLLGRRAAIKVLLPELSMRTDFVHRFFNEARAVTQIADPGIVQVFEFGFAADARAFIVMELLDGEPMSDRLAKIGAFTPVDALRLVRLLCSSLHAAHAKGVVHRDLKPDNIFIVGDSAVTGGERTKILDFGIAKLSADEHHKAPTTLTGMMLGTPQYMAPEQCRGLSVIDHRADIYALGCVLMTMLTGRPPFEGAGSGDLIVAHVREAPPRASSRVPGVPPIIDDIIERCLAKDPAQRFHSMLELGEALAAAEQSLVGGAAMARGSFVNLPGPEATTLSGVASQIAVTPARRGYRGAVIAITAAALASALGTAWIATRAPSPRAPAPAAATDDDSRTVTLPLEARPEAARVDAGAPDAAPPDAAKPKRSKPRRESSQPQTPGGQDASSPAGDIDRGD